MGSATDTSGKTFTILVETFRFGKEAAIMYGIGSNSPGSEFITHCSVGNGLFPDPTYNSWSTSAACDTVLMNCEMTSGILGLTGATYKIEMIDPNHNVTVSLILKDSYGMVLEGYSGAFNKAGGTDSFEFAMPSMIIQEGSKITIGKEISDLVDGSMWLDRQTLGKSGRQVYRVRCM